MPKTERELLARDAKRDIGAELLESVRQMKAAKVKRVAAVKLTPAAAARLKTGLSQSQFAASMGVSVRTLQDWEQGRREPSGAAQTLLRIAAKHPRVVREAVAG
ncbi:MAG: helix-turn-helix domain-containing protein [Pseudomonadota bacterium]